MGMAMSLSGGQTDLASTPNVVPIRAYMPLALERPSILWI